MAYDVPTVRDRSSISYPEAVESVHGLKQTMRMQIANSNCDDYAWYGYGDVYAYTDQCCDKGTCHVYLCVNGEADSSQQLKGLWLLNGLTSLEVSLNGPFALEENNDAATTGHVNLNSREVKFASMDDEVWDMENVMDVVKKYQWEYVVYYGNDDGEVDVFCSGSGTVKNQYRNVPGCA